MSFMKAPVDPILIFPCYGHSKLYEQCCVLTFRIRYHIILGEDDWSMAMNTQVGRTRAAKHLFSLCSTSALWQQPIAMVSIIIGKYPGMLLVCDEYFSNKP